MSSHIIEINGKRYDALSGKVLDSKPAGHTNVKTNAKAVTGQVLDGFVRRPKKAHSPAAPSKAVHSKTSRSKTLMRGAVKKPVAEPKKSEAKNYTIYTPPSTELKPARSSHIDHVRANRAAKVHKSSLVSRFGNTRSNITKHIEPLAVKPAPKHADTMAPHAISAPLDRVIQKTATEPEDTFSQALKNAVSHKQPKLKRPNLSHRIAKKLRVSPRTLNIAAGVFVSLFVGGLVAYQHIPALAIKMAATRAGVRAQLPSYKPSGFSLKGPVQYSSGIVTLSYASNSDDRSFQIVQKNTDWNSQTLLENLVEAKESYQTFQDRGRTVYIYDGSNAAWVNGGVLYQIEGAANLSSDQLRRIISGL